MPRFPRNSPVILFIILVLSMAHGGVYAQDAPTQIGLGPVSQFTLANGMQVLVAPSRDANLVTVDVWVGAGTRRETPDSYGAAHFIEHLIFKGTPTRKPGEIDAAIEDLGGTLNAATSYDWAHFYVTVGAFDAPAAASVLADAVQHATLRQADMDTERNVILSERARELSNPAQRTSQQASALLFPDHAYGRPLLGTPDQITGMSRQTVLDFYKTFYVPGNTTLILSGRITPEAGHALAEKVFGAWPARPVPADKSAPEPQPTAVRALTQTAGTRDAYLTLAWRAPSVYDQPDAWVMDVLLTYLGQAGNSRLDIDLRRKAHLVSNITANYLTQRDAGLISVTAVFAPGQLGRVQSAVLADIAALRDTPLSATDLGNAKRALLASYLFDTQTNSGRAYALGFYNTIDTFHYDTDYIANVLSVTPGQVQAVASKYLSPDTYAQVTLLPRANPIVASSAR